MEIQLCVSEKDILNCWDVLYALRPHLLQNEFVPIIKELMTEGYQLAFIEEDGKAVAAIGFRYLQYLYNGKHIYIDDLSTLPTVRGKGYGGKLLDYVAAIAKEKGYKIVTLDSGYLRTDAHRLYLNKKFTMVAHHFSKNIK
ncbi:GNAT family N-acetyltransferase [Ferruginibacter sp.]|uniref:GNAT family N-acetyltransferase n=1 Tax=Ferruginibacter sp. TaxID=1940288 RepID=UPI002659EEBE|nr:GNAT family N-acetyltransferase [Ferruginibacter sp.]